MDDPINPHHLLLGELTDFLTGLVLPDTHDERYRQKIAELLVYHCGFDKSSIENNTTVKVAAGERIAKIPVDFLVSHQGKIIILIKYAPGSLVTRRLSTLALSRIIRPYQIPMVIVTNGEDAEIIDGDTGHVISSGLQNIPEKKDMVQKFHDFSFNTISPRISDQASRIVFACEINGACPCDTDICIID